MDGARVLVTGPTGNLVFPVVQELAKTNDVWGMARFSNDADRERVQALGVTCIRKDLATDSFDDVPDDFDYVLHAGAMVAMGSERDMAYTFEVNVQGTGRLMYHCRKAKTFLHCSTGGVYAHQTHPVRETDPYGMPIPAYSMSKIAAEQLVRFASLHWNIPAIMLRIGAVYGPDRGGPTVRLDRMIRGKEVWINPEEPRVVSVMWIDDVIRLAIKALTSGQVPPPVVNFSGDDPVSIEDYCIYSGKLLGIEPKFRYTDETYPANSMDTSRMHEILGKCETGWKEGFRRLIANRYPDMPRRAVDE